MNTDVEATQTPVETVPTPPELIVKKDFCKNYGISYNLIILGVAAIVVGAYSLFIISAMGFLIGFGIFYIIIGLSTPLKFRERFFFFDRTPFAPKIMINYNEITEIEYLPKRIVVHYKGTQVKLEKGAFSTNDWIDINKIFKTIKE